MDKLDALMKKGVDSQIKKGMACLYLGASTGTGLLHVSEIIGSKGVVFGIDISKTTTRELLQRISPQGNVAPILADASRPETYAHRMCAVDWVFQDISQKDQVGIFVKNAEWFLKQGGVGLLIFKAAGVDVVHPGAAISRAREELSTQMQIIAETTLEPFHKLHHAFIATLK